MPENFWDVGENADLPRLWESVCIEPPECGGTHFATNEAEFFIDYWRYESEALAQKALDDSRITAVQVVREAPVYDKLGVTVGYKILLRGNADSGESTFSLAWTRGKRFAIVRSDSLDALVTYENDRDF